MDELLGPLPSPADPFTVILVVVLAGSRMLDFLSTWLVTPGLELEANPLMRRVSWGKMALLNLPLLGLPFLHHGMSITFIVTSLLVSGTNLANGALARGMGEKRHIQSQMRALQSIGLAGALAMNSAGAIVICAAGAFLMALGGGEKSLSWWGGLGVAMYGVSGLVHLNLGIVRLHRRAGKDRSAGKTARTAR